MRSRLVQGNLQNFRMGTCHRLPAWAASKRPAMQPTRAWHCKAAVEQMHVAFTAHASLCAPCLISGHFLAPVRAVHGPAWRPLANARLGALDRVRMSSGSSLTSDEEEEDMGPRMVYPPMNPMLEQAEDWTALQTALVSRGTVEALGVDDVVAVLRRATQLAVRSQDIAGGATSASTRLVARTVVVVCCLVLLRDLPSLDTVTVAGALSALGLLAAQGALPSTAGRAAPRELLAAAVRLTHRARMAGAGGLLGPNQLAGVLRGAALLAPQYVTPDWLDEAQRQLGPRAVRELAPASIAALVGAITQARRGRCKRWQPNTLWLAELQREVHARLTDFSGFELAATLYGLVDLTTTSNPAPLPPPTPARPGPRPSASPFFRRKATPEDWTHALAEQRRIQRLRAAWAETAQPPVLLPALVEEMQAWRHTCWDDQPSPLQHQQQRQQAPAHQAADAVGGAQPAAGTDASSSTSSTARNLSGTEAVLKDPSGQTVASSPADPMPSREAPPEARPGLSEGNGTGGAIDGVTSVTYTSSSVTVTAHDATGVAAAIAAAVAVTANADWRSGGLQQQQQQQPASQVEPGSASSMAASDLALLLLAKTRLALPGFVPARPLTHGMLPMEVTWAEHEMGVGPWDGKEEEEEEEDE